MAQLVEQRIRNAWVAGSSPAVGSMKLQVSRLCGWPFCLLGKTFRPIGEEMGKKSSQEILISTAIS